jgi:hypothetical protein
MCKYSQLEEEKRNQHQLRNYSHSCILCEMFDPYRRSCDYLHMHIDEINDYCYYYEYLEFY